ncbi:MAG TPA: hypothetical protein VED01_23695 [Burkholderiales bacterium]|nr:hypothetical protein [Burkholderiales bacterium]
MAWVDSMRLRRRADGIRMVGWINLLLSVAWAVVHASDGLGMMALSGAWAALVLALVYGVAWVIDKHAEKVVRR